jgi:hypothetical protein
MRRKKTSTTLMHECWEMSNELQSPTHYADSSHFSCSNKCSFLNASVQFLIQKTPCRALFITPTDVKLECVCAHLPAPGARLNPGACIVYRARHFCCLWPLVINIWCQSVSNGPFAPRSCTLFCDHVPFYAEISHFWSS